MTTVSPVPPKTEMEAELSEQFENIDISKRYVRIKAVNLEEYVNDMNLWYIRGISLPTIFGICLKGLFYECMLELNLNC